MSIKMLDWHLFWLKSHKHESFSTQLQVGENLGDLILKSFAGYSWTSWHNTINIDKIQ